MSLIIQTSLPPSGSRRLTPDMLGSRDQADRFVGVVPGTGKPLRYLAAFQEALPYLGLPAQTFTLVAWLVKQTKNCDWEQGSRPICWPSAARQEEFLGLSPARVKVLNRLLFEAGILIMRDSPTGKRYGRRAPDGRIIEAYGFDLSPLAVRYDEFIFLATEARAERESMRSLKRRATIARRAIRQTGEALAVLGPLPPGWPKLEMETAELVAAIKHAGRSQELAPIVDGLESRQIEVEAWLRKAAKPAESVENPVETSPSGLGSKPHIITTNLSLHLEDTVVPAEESRPTARVQTSSSASVQATIEILEKEKAATDPDPTPIDKIYPSELLLLAPLLAAYVFAQFPTWNDIVDAAGNLCYQLGISKHLWGEACRILGRPRAAVALAIVSTKPKGHFTRGPGGYFAGMVKRATTGQLNLDRTIWKLRKEKESANKPTPKKPLKPLPVAVFYDDDLDTVS